MNTRWFLPEHRPGSKAKEDFEFAIQNSSVLSNRFIQILEDMENELFKYEGDLTNYTEGWAAKQAFVNGKRKAIRDIRALFNFG